MNITISTVAFLYFIGSTTQKVFQKTYTKRCQSIPRSLIQHHYLSHEKPTHQQPTTTYISNVFN